MTLGDVASETAKFTNIVDKFFDALNVSNFDSVKHQRKPLNNPYRSATNFRLKVSRNKYAVARGDLFEILG